MCDGVLLRLSGVGKRRGDCSNVCVRRCCDVERQRSQANQGHADISLYFLSEFMSNIHSINCLKECALHQRGHKNICMYNEMRLLNL